MPTTGKSPAGPELRRLEAALAALTVTALVCLASSVWAPVKAGGEPSAGTPRSCHSAGSKVQV